MVNGHSLVQSVYVLAGQQFPLTLQLYRRKVTCEAEGHPPICVNLRAQGWGKTREEARETLGGGSEL
ncbi:MAG: hypothetical protein KKB13_14595 [Chloroflexi bacterium]|nr:hypothetical protein [Chloroflexota bacterium]